MPQPNWSGLFCASSVGIGGSVTPGGGPAKQLLRVAFSVLPDYGASQDHLRDGGRRNLVVRVDDSDCVVVSQPEHELAAARQFALEKSLDRMADAPIVLLVWAGEKV